MKENQFELRMSDQAQEENPFWLSIGDLMSGLFLVFVLLLLSVLFNLSKQLESQKNTKTSIFQEIKRQLHLKNINVEIDSQQGTITITDDILFDFNETDLKEEGKLFLQRFIPTFANVLFSKEDFRKEISRLLIEGHTDKIGDSSVNLRVSLLRSFSVANHLISEEMEYKNESDRSETLKRILPSGRGKFDAQNSFVRNQDRRVIFRIQFRDVEILENWTNLQRSMRTVRH